MVKIDSLNCCLACYPEMQPVIIPGVGLSLAAGAGFGWTFGQETAIHHLELYRLDTMAAQTKFLEWWLKKVD
ncbi:hypothetical protein ACH5RR_009588 [Cinchona calisaya]|uniref:Uncharacterized protein n=1 Tax=Cinchona calisaya TaxID=153742 RepID=A0ABD3AEL7_9GENT